MSALRFVASGLACLAAATAQNTTTGVIFEVSADNTTSYTIEAALAEAGPGDTLNLKDGVYKEPIVTMSAGEEGKPLTIQGTRDAVINGFTGNRTMRWSQKVVDIRHSWITLKGFTVNGQISTVDEEESFVDKCIYVEGNANETEIVTYEDEEVETILIGFRMEEMHIMNCGMECVRIRNFVTHAVIADNTIEECGIWDYRYRFDGEIGEGIYIGSSSNQWDFGKFTTNGPDRCDYNLIIGNTITPNANECVDIKEGSSFNIIEDTDCSKQYDPDSGCFSVRGSNNIVRNNRAGDCAGAGVRVGGHVADDVVYGVENEIFNNEFYLTGNLRNETYDEGGGSISVMEIYQGQVCGNTCEGDYCDIKEKSKCLEDDTCDDALIDYTVEWTWDQPCDTTDGYLGCYVEDTRGIIADYDSDVFGVTAQACQPKCSESEVVGTIGEECWCGVQTSYTFFYPCYESNDGEECDDFPCVRMFDLP